MSRIEAYAECTDVYDKALERAVIWNDPDLAIAWPIDAAELTLSDKDQAAPRFTEAHGWFAL